VLFDDSLHKAGFPGNSRALSALEPSSDKYFPSGTWSGYEGSDEFVSNWYSSRLAAMKEPSLLNLPAKPTHVYRFVWLRSFHRPIAVRVWRENCRSYLVAKELDGRGGYEPGKLVHDKRKPLTETEWLGFLRLLNQTNYWQMPTEIHEGGNEGAEWILEGIRDGRYHIVERWSPRAGEYRAACLYLLNAAGLGVTETDPDVY
jgi:hypothetical protein